jgi:uncharacterized membrane protein
MVGHGMVFVDPVFSLMLCILITVFVFAVEHALHRGHRSGRH